ncbi:MAG: AcrB/AcrD/AcrF family protein [Syntrophus sp. SKADARSKE-3]|nr:AcrB/AcrD/AcrF family protein [Syntrophus sp. SKADARSKE-3]
MFFRSRETGIFRFRLIVIAVIMVMLFLCAGCGKKEEKAAPEKVVNVKAVVVEKKSLRPYVEAIGSLKPYEEVIVSSEIDGILKKITVTEGMKVHKNMLLAEVNEIDYRLGVRQAEAALRQAEATLANARQEFQRKESLYKEQLVTRQQYDDIFARKEVADSDVERAKSTLALVKEKLLKTKIYAPMTGAVKEKRVTAGDFVKSGTPMVSLIQTDPLKLNFTVVEKDVGKLKVGQEVAFRVDSFPDRTFKGRLKNIYANMEEKTRSLQLEAIIPNAQDTLKPGLFARVILYTGEPRDVIVIPITALLYEATDVKVFLVEKERAVERAIKVGQKYDGMMEVIEGLKGGEQLVVAGQNNLAKGVKINVAR